MTKKGVKIKELARELGVTSRTLIDKCREAGIPAQNSITKLSDQHADQARSWFRSERSPDGDEPSDAPTPS